MSFKSKQKGFLSVSYSDIVDTHAKKTSHVKSFPEHVSKKKESGNYSKDVISLALKKHGK